MTTDLLQFLAWYLVSSLFGLLGLPLAFGLFRNLPGRGFAFIRPLGLLAVGYVFWLLGSLGLLRNDLPGILFSVALVGIVGTAWLRRPGLEELGLWIKTEWKAVCAVEMVFLVAFAGWTVVRLYQPEIQGTEKPMEFMMLNSILRSPVLPPQDAWLSGHAISYYYFGYLLTSLPARLAATSPGVAFNLAIALWFGLAAISALGVVWEMAVLVLRKLDVPPAKPGRVLMSAFYPALLGPLLVLVVGNWYGALGLLHANGQLAEFKIPAIYYDFGQSEGETLVAEPGIKAGLVNAWEWLDLKQLSSPPPASSESWRWDLGNWFFAARVLHDRSLTGDETEAIDENPAFSFLLGDLHPHVLSLPFVLLAVGLALQTLTWGWEETELAYAWKKFLPAYLLAAVVLGSLLVLNTWDYPVYAFLVAAGLLVGAGVRLGWPGLRPELGRWLLGLTLWLGLSVVSYLPFFITFQSQAGGVLPNVFTPTRFQQFLVMFAPLLGALLFFLLAWRAHSRGFFESRAAWTVGGGLLLLLAVISALLAWAALQIEELQPYILNLISPFQLSKALSLVVQRRLVDSLAALLMTAMVGMVVGLLVGLVRRKQPLPDSLQEPACWMALILTGVGALLVLGPEFVFLRDNFWSRMNTLFKFYFQAWVLWALAGAFVTWYLWHSGSVRLRLGLGLVVGVPVLLGLVYLPTAMWRKTGGFSGRPTLDGIAYFTRQYPADWAAIQWLDANAAPGAVIVEGSQGAYWVEGRSSRISMATGLPTLIGWANHESQWRGSYFTQVSHRLDDLRTIYQSRDWKNIEALLDAYQVEYVVVSDLEREWYRPLQETKFLQNMRAVLQAGDLTLYQRR
jgi:YYY domain-containing protein